MSDFNNILVSLMASNDKEAARELMEEMKGKLETACPSDCKILKKRIRLIKDYLNEDAESEKEI